MLRLRFVFVSRVSASALIREGARGGDPVLQEGAPLRESHSGASDTHPRGLGQSQSRARHKPAVIPPEQSPVSPALAATAAANRDAGLPDHTAPSQQPGHSYTQLSKRS